MKSIRTRYTPKKDGDAFRVWDRVLERFPLGVGAKRYTHKEDCAERCTTLNAWN